MRTLSGYCDFFLFFGVKGVELCRLTHPGDRQSKADMLNVILILLCAMILTSECHGTVVAEQEEHDYLETILHMYDDKSYGSAETLSDLLLMISTKTSETGISQKVSI